MIEIIAVIFQGMLELLYDIILQFVLQAIAAALLQFIAWIICYIAHEKLPQWALLLSYTIFGIMTGFISRALFPHIFIHGQLLRWVALLVIPLLVGALFSLLGLVRRKFGQQHTSLDHFLYAYVFALSMALVRFWSIQ